MVSSATQHREEGDRVISMWLMSKEGMAGVDEQGNKTAEYEPDVEAMPPRPDISFYASARAGGSQ